MPAILPQQRPVLLVVLVCQLASHVSADCSLVSYNGCYSDAGVRPVSYLAIEGDTSMTLERCMYTCASGGFVVIAATGHTTPSPAEAYCYCGSVVAPGAKVAPDANCNVPCPGNATEDCGGNGFSSVWTLSCNVPLPPQPIGPPLPAGPACSQPQAAEWPFCNASLPIDDRVADLVARISLIEAGAQLTSRQSPAIPRLGIPAFYWGTNAIHGITNDEQCVVASDNSTRCASSYAHAIALAASWNDSMWYTMGATTAREMRAYTNLSPNDESHVDALTAWGPTINIVRDPRWGRVQETCGEDPVLCGRFGMAVSAGLQTGSDSRWLLTAATLKHFFAYSLEDYDNHTWTRQTFDALVPAFDVGDTYTPAFETAIARAGAAGIMYACNSVNGIPADANLALLSLLTQWGFDGYRTTDGGQIENIIVGHHYAATIEEAIADASAARSDIADGPEYAQSLGETVMRGFVNMSVVQALLTNTFRIRFRLGLFEPLAAAPYRDIGADDVHTAADEAALRLSSAQALVLLKNQNMTGGTAGRAVLPLAPPIAGATVAVIGPNGADSATLAGSYAQPCVCAPCGTACYPGVAAAIAARWPAANVSYAPGSGINVSNASALAAAVALASRADTIVFVLGLNQALECEQNDRFNISLPAPQRELYFAVRSAARAGVPVVLVLVHGGAVALGDVAADAPAILDAFYPGVAGGIAVAQALYGDVNPGGKLPYTVYDESFQTLSNFTHMSMTEGVGRSYRYYGANSSIARPPPPEFTFGFGLSYSAFSVAWAGAPPPSPLPLAPSSTAALNVSLCNTGPLDGDDVLQLYFAPVAVAAGAAALPLRQLLDFARVHVAVDACAPLSFTLRAADMLLTDAAGARSVYAGSYAVTVTNGAGQQVEVDVTVSA